MRDAILRDQPARFRARDAERRLLDQRFVLDVAILHRIGASFARHLELNRLHARPDLCSINSRCDPKLRSPPECTATATLLLNSLYSLYDATPLSHENEVTKFRQRDLR